MQVLLPPGVGGQGGEVQVLSAEQSYHIPNKDLQECLLTIVALQIINIKYENKYSISVSC